MMKIIYLGNFNVSEKLSGPEKIAKRLFSSTSAVGVEVTFIEYFFKNYPDYSPFNRLFGFKTICGHPKVIRAGILQVLYYLIRHKPDIIHIVTYKRYIIVVLLLKSLFTSKIVVTLHGIVKYEIPKSRLKQSKYGIIKDLFMEKLFLKKADLLVFLSESQLEIANLYYNFPLQKVKILPNGIDEIFYNRRDQIFVVKKPKIVFYNGYSHEVKGIDILLKALSCFETNCYELFILGNKPSIEIVKDINVSYVSFLESEDLINFLSDKDIYINSSEFDSFSLFAIEAMANGLCVIISNNVGMCSYIRHNQNGFMFDYSHPEELAEILKRIMNGEVDLRNISENATKIYHQLNWNVVCNMYLDEFRELLLNK